MRLQSASLQCIALLFAPPAIAGNEFVGDYNGNSFETASGMRISKDGTFQWYISVGALDMRAKGTWVRRGDTIAFTPETKPVPPEFAYAGSKETPEGSFLSIVNAANGEPFDYASLIVLCANGIRVSDQARSGSWSPAEEDGCDTPEKVQLRLSTYDVRSPFFDLTGPRKPKPGHTVLFEFRPNDIGIADFTGVTGSFDEDGVLVIRGPLGEQEFRKMEPRARQTSRRSRTSHTSPRWDRVQGASRRFPLRS